MKIEIVTKNQVENIITGKLKCLWSEIDKLYERIRLLEEENKTLRFEK